MPIRRKPRPKLAEGTQRADTIDATAPGEVLRGLGGNDLLRSTFDRTKLFGDAGHDRLVTTLDITDQRTVLARQFGGTGNDVLRANVSADSNLYDPKSDTYLSLTSEVFQDGGAGNDSITVRNYAVGLGHVEVVNTVGGGAGDDTIKAVAEIEQYSGPMSSAATNRIDGGDGDDRIEARATGDSYGLGSYSTNIVDGGAGDDIIDVYARVNANTGDVAKNVVVGGPGDDVIRADAYAGSNSSSAIAENFVHGGGGNDVLRIGTSASDENSGSYLEVGATGGAGSDDIVSKMYVGVPIDVGATARLAGGTGHDRLVSTVTWEYPSGEGRIWNRMIGGEGEDEIVARLDLPESDDGFGWVSARSRLDGGEGDDTLTAEIVGKGRSLLYGGSGDDVLKVVGGNANLLAGGGGNDRLFSGSGNDQMLAGPGADDFLFDLREDQGNDLLLDFDFFLGHLCFIGITDAGARGLADDLDAVSSIDDEGADADVVATFDAGTVLRLVGCGTGSVDSFADLVDNPLDQLQIEPL